MEAPKNKTREDALEIVRRIVAAGGTLREEEEALMAEIVRGSCRISPRVWLWLEQIERRVKGGK